MDELIIEYHRPMSGFVTVTKGENFVILDMRNWDKLPSDPKKRNKQLLRMLK